MQDFGVGEHEQILEVVKHAVMYDQLSIVNSVAFEVLLRRAQMIEYAHAERLKEHRSKGAGKMGVFLSLEEQESFQGTTRAGIMVAPALLDHVREDVSRKNELMKSLLKAKDFREQVQKLNKGGDGK